MDRPKEFKIPTIILLLLIALCASSCYQDQGFGAFYQAYQKDPLPKAVQQEVFFLQPEILSQNIEQCHSYQNHLQNFDEEAFSPRNKRRYQQIQQDCAHFLKQIIPYTLDPSLYNMGGQIKYILAQHSSPLDDRLERIQQHLVGIKKYYEIGKVLQSKSLPNKALLGAQKQLLAIQFMDTELKDSLTIAGLKAADRENLDRQIHEAKLVLKDYLAFCESLYFEYQDTIPLKYE